MQWEHHVSMGDAEPYDHELAGPTGVDEGAVFVDLPCDDPERWGRIEGVLRPLIATPPATYEQLGATLDLRSDDGRALAGLAAACGGGGGGGDISASFLSTTLPHIVSSALRLPELLEMVPEGRVRKLPQLGAAGRCSTSIPRPLVHSLLANMLLCTFEETNRSAMPLRSFEGLLVECDASQEVAKLRMVMHYFERTGDGADLQGTLRLSRTRAEQGFEAWSASAKPLLPMSVAPQGVGFENPAFGAHQMHADFANEMLGGGVLVGGCVQEEIRFAICPELIVGLLTCPVMLQSEAIQIVGAEQMSAYTGYAWSLRYAGDFVDSSARDADGTVMNGIAAIDALDLRGNRMSPAEQMLAPLMLREMNKSLAGFEPMDPVTAAALPSIATGNWGCGVFGGFVELKAVLQWLAASEANQKITYFPYDAPFGPRLEQFSEAVVGMGATVGQLATVLQLVSYIVEGGPAAVEQELEWCRSGTFLEGLLVVLKSQLGPQDDRITSG